MPEVRGSHVAACRMAARRQDTDPRGRRIPGELPTCWATRSLEREGPLSLMTGFNLKFAEKDIGNWFEQYPTDALSPVIEQQIVPRVRIKGFVTRKDFLTLCRWKTNRTQGRCAGNSPEFIKSVSRISLYTADEQLRISIWTLLDGVSWPTASALLHWLHPEEYPVLDFRALWSLGYNKPPPYNFAFWKEYVRYCRALAKRCNLSVRMLDRALWQYSATNQKP
jgi:hypothetical protein